MIMFLLFQVEHRRTLSRFLNSSFGVLGLIECID